MKNKKINKKQNNMKWLIPILSLLALLIVLMAVYLKSKPNKEILSQPLRLENVNTINAPENYVFKSYQDFKEMTNSNLLTDNDFNNHNYVLVRLVWDSCSEDDIDVLGYELQNNTVVFKYTYRAGCGVCAPLYDYYLVPVDKNITSVDLQLNGVPRNRPHCDPNVSYKPLIYIYPERETNVTVKLGYPEKLTTTYPKYENEWKVIAYPNGDLKDENNKFYYGLYWEGLNDLNPTFEDGFVVKGEDTISFLEEKLTTLGLNSKERNEFIIFWLPKLEQNNYNLIRFESIDNINKEMPLEINPKPDTLIRVLMEFKAIDKEISIKEQKLTTPIRNGFTVVEWGGTIIK